MGWLLFLLLLAGLSVGQKWNAKNYPNPTAGQFEQCGMRTHAKICDPDGVLDEASRSRLDYELSQLEARTRQDNAGTFCEKKGITPAMAVARRVQGGTTEDVKAMANAMLGSWTLDAQCHKAIVIVVSTEDAKFWVARDDKVPVYAAEFTELFMQQKELFKRQQYVEALKNLLQGTWEKALSKQAPSKPSSSGNRGSGGFGSGGQRPSQGFGDATREGSNSGSHMSNFKIPSWFWLTLIFVIIPLLCCCCCLYCCCCRGKGGTGGEARQPVPQDIPAGSGGGGGGRGPFGNFLSTLSGAGVGSMLGNFLSSRNHQGGGGMGMGGMGYGGGEYQGGGAYPAEPQPPVHDDNSRREDTGLYPSVSVKDEGGGGSWA